MKIADMKIDIRILEEKLGEEKSKKIEAAYSEKLLKPRKKWLKNELGMYKALLKDELNKFEIEDDYEDDYYEDNLLTFIDYIVYEQKMEGYTIDTDLEQFKILYGMYGDDYIQYCKDGGYDYERDWGRL